VFVVLIQAISQKRILLKKRCLADIVFGFCFFTTDLKKIFEVTWIKKINRINTTRIKIICDHDFEKTSHTISANRFEKWFICWSFLDWTRTATIGEVQMMVYIHVYIHTCVYVCMCVCLCVILSSSWKPKMISTYIYVYIYMCMYIYAHKINDIYVYMYIRIYMYTYTHMYVYEYLCTYISVLVPEFIRRMA